MMASNRTARCVVTSLVAFRGDRRDKVREAPMFRNEWSQNTQ